MKRPLALSLLVVSALGSTPGFAQSSPPHHHHHHPPAPPPPPATPPPPPAPPSLSDSLTGDAKANYEAGKVLFVDGDFAGALIKFTSAYEASRDPRLLWNMAACEKNLRHYANVLALVHRYLDDKSDRLSDKDRTEARDLLTVIEPFTVRVKVVVNEAGAEVSIDDKVAGTSPLAEPIVVDIGSRRLSVHKEGFKDATSSIAVGGAPTMDIAIKLEPEVHEGRLRIATARENRVTIDDRLAGAGDVAVTLKSGGHRLVVTAAGMRPFQSEVVIQDNESRTIDVTLEPVPHAGVPTWVWIAGTGVVIAGGALAGYALLKPKDEVSQPVAGTLSPGVLQLGFRRR